MFDHGMFVYFDWFRAILRTAPFDIANSTTEYVKFHLF